MQEDIKKLIAYSTVAHMGFVTIGIFAGTTQGVAGGVFAFAKGTISPDELRAAFARLVRGEPDPTEHDQVRWLAQHELDDVDWLEPDRPFLAEIRALIGGTAFLGFIAAPKGQNKGFDTQSGYAIGNYTGFLAPKLALFSNIALMAAVLLWRPQGVYPVVNR